MVMFLFDLDGLWEMYSSIVYSMCLLILNYSNSGNACTLIIKVQVYLILKCLDKGTAVQPSSWGFNLWFLRS